MRPEILGKDDGTDLFFPLHQGTGTTSDPSCQFLSNEAARVDLVINDSPNINFGMQYFVFAQS